MNPTFETLKNLLEADRSVRRFIESKKISNNTLMQLIGLVPFCASARNAQPLKYRVVSSDAECANVFPALAWAGYYKNWSGPAEGERPVAYLVQCLDTEIAANADIDAGIQLQAITLGATALGISCCCIKAFSPEKVNAALQLDTRFKPLLVIALGYASEKVKLVEMSDNDFIYFRDSDDAQCVPKRSVDALILS